MTIRTFHDDGTAARPARRLGRLAVVGLLRLACRWPESARPFWFPRLACPRPNRSRPMQSPDWYPMTVLPSGTVYVRIRHGAYVLAAASNVDRKGVRHWHEVRGRELVPLAFDPEAWQPMAPDKWRWPGGVAPDALPVMVFPRLAMIGGVAFDAAASSAELEAERLARCAETDDGEERSNQWWRDVARVAYQAMGEVDREHGEARIMRALILERSIRLDLARYRTNAAVLAALKMTLADVLAEEPGADWVPPLVAMPEDWRDFETVMGWFVETLPSKREIMVLRSRMNSPPATWRQIGDEIGRTGRRAQQIYDATVDGLVDVANRPPRRAKARLAELQERNREARRP